MTGTVLSLCGLTPGDVLPYRELAERVLGSHSDTRPPGGYLRRLSVDGFMPV